MDQKTERFIKLLKHIKGDKVIGTTLDDKTGSPRIIRLISGTSYEDGRVLVGEDVVVTKIGLSRNQERVLADAIFEVHEDHRKKYIGMLEEWVDGIDIE